MHGKAENIATCLMAREITGIIESHDFKPFASVLINLRISPMPALTHCQSKKKGQEQGDREARD
jgi:hypothetical protein